MLISMVSKNLFGCHRLFRVHEYLLSIISFNIISLISKITLWFMICKAVIYIVSFVPYVLSWNRWWGHKCATHPRPTNSKNTGWHIQNGTAYFLQYVDAITSISVWNNFSWEKWYQDQQFWFSSLFSMSSSTFFPFRPKLDANECQFSLP